jgi:hypothetical protein
LEELKAIRANMATRLKELKAERSQKENVAIRKAKPEEKKD